MSDRVIRIEGVSKKFCRTLKHTMLYGATDLARRFAGLDGRSETLREGEFWAVEDVSFELKRGECVGLIGPNGSGKSTLLKMLNGIYMPDRGRIEVNGRVGALIEVGAGFHPMLTGRENVYINGAILGLSKKEIDKKFDEIVDFAEIEAFIDSPVKHYSSGMYVRLGFAIAAQLRPDVLLIDEVLAVGDVGFRAKCYNYMAGIIKETAVLFVSHSMPQIGRVCNNLVVMNKGRHIFEGNVARGIEQYYSLFSGEKNLIAGTGRAVVENLRLTDEEGNERDTIAYGQSLVLEFDVTVDAAEAEPCISVTLASQELQVVAQCHTRYNRVNWINRGRKTAVKLLMPDLCLNPDTYLLSLIIFDGKNAEHMAWHFTAKRIVVTGDFLGGAPYQVKGEWEIVEEN